MQADESVPRNQKRCRECASTIDAQATKYINCGAYQDWRRFIVVGNTTLALLIALITVIGAAAPTIISVLQTPNSDIRVAISSLTPQQIGILASNNGTRPGSVADVTLSVQRSGFDGVPVTLKRDGSGMVKPQASVEVVFGTPGSAWIEKYLAGDLGGLLSTCTIAVNTAEFDGSSKKVMFKRHCSFLFGLRMPPD